MTDDRRYMMAGQEADEQPETMSFDPIQALKNLGMGDALPEEIQIEEKPLELTEPLVAESDIPDAKRGVTTIIAAPSGGYATEKAAYAASGSKEAMRFNTGKPRYELLPPDSIEELVGIYTMGAEKYDARNWEKGMSWGSTFASLMRHAFSWLRGEDTDPESGKHHMAHVAWNALALVSFSKRGIGTDDRSKA